MQKICDILVAGEINPDLVLSGDVIPAFGQVEKILDDVTLTIGSSGVIFACGAVRLGFRVAVVGMVGEDTFGRFMLEAMQERGIDTHAVVTNNKNKTGISIILNRGTDRAIFTQLGVISDLNVTHIPDELLQQARHFHVSSYYLQTGLHSGLIDLFRRAKELGVSTSLDTNWDPSGNWSGVLELLSQTTVFLPNEAEACAIAGFNDVERAARLLANYADVVAVKLGAAGSLGVCGNECIKMPSLPVQTVDTTGAGDSFNAGFLYGHLAGFSLQESLRMGVACGALSTRKAGGTTAQPTLAEVQEALNNNGR